MSSKFHWEEIQKIAKAHHIQDPLDNEDAFTRFLQFWWCRKYNRPFKDPLLFTYTIEELTYEWLRHIYLLPDQDPRKELEAKNAREDEDAWIREQLKKVKSQVATNPAKADVEPPEPVTPEIPDLPPLPDISTKFD